MGKLYRLVLICLALLAVLHDSSAGRKGGFGTKTSTKTSSSSSSKSSSSSSSSSSKTTTASNKPVQGSNTKANYPRQPSGSYPAGGQYPGQGGSRPAGYPNPYPAGGSYPAGGQNPAQGGSRPAGYPNPYPAGGSYPAGGQYPAQGGSRPGGYPNPYPAGGSYPAGGQNPAQGGSRPGGYPNQYPAGGQNPGGYPAGGSYPAGGQYPAQGGSRPGGYPAGGQNPGGNPNQYPAGGSYPAGGQYPAQGGSRPGGYPNQYPGGSYPAGGQYPAQGGSRPGGYPSGGQNPGGYPNQYPGGGSYPAGGQYPARGGVNPGGYPNQYPAWGGNPAAGNYPVRTGSQPAGGYPFGGGAYPNWNPNNKILSPRYGGGFGGGFGGTGMGGSPFSHSVQSMGYGPSAKSKGFAKKAMLAAGVGAMAGMAVGYGLGSFPRPNFSFRSPQEEQYYNHYMHQRYSSKSTDNMNRGGQSTGDINQGRQSPDRIDYGPDGKYKPPPQAQSYERYMDHCMNRTDLLLDQDTKTSKVQSEVYMSGSPAFADGILEKTIPAENILSNFTKNETSSEYPSLASSPVEESGTKAEGPMPAGLQQRDDDEVGIVEIGYPALIQQMKARRCVQMYMVYSEGFQQKQIEDKPKRNDHKGINGCPSSGSHLLLTTIVMIIGSALWLQ